MSEKYVVYPALIKTEVVRNGCLPSYSREFKKIEDRKTIGWINRRYRELFDKKTHYYTRLIDHIEENGIITILPR